MRHQQTDSSRPLRVAALIKKEVAKILSQELNDPRLANITITAVDVPRDLASARVFFTSAAANDKPQEITSLLNKAAGFVRSSLKGRLELRGIPSLRFVYDESIQRGAEIDRLLGDLHSDDQ